MAMNQKMKNSGNGVRLSLHYLVMIFASLFCLAIANAQAPAEEPSNREKVQLLMETNRENKKLARETFKKNTKSTQKKSAAKKKADKKAAPRRAENNLPKEVTELISQDMVAGTGPVAEKGKTLIVNYTGWLYDPSKPQGRGKEFDTSVGKKPFEFKLGEGQVIQGWDQGFAKMKAQGKRTLIIPPTLGYGETGAGDAIPPNAPLLFEVELLDVQ